MQLGIWYIANVKAIFNILSILLGVEDLRCTCETLSPPPPQKKNHQMQKDILPASISAFSEGKLRVCMCGGILGVFLWKKPQKLGS